MTGSGRPFGVNVVGHVSGNLGLGVVARAMIRVALEREIPLAAFDVDPGGGRGGYDLTLRDHCVASVDRLPHAVNIFILPPQSIAGPFGESLSALFLRPDVLNAGLMFWEHVTVPRRWLDILAILDVVLAPSHFIRATFASNLPEAVMVNARCPVDLPPGVVCARDRLGLAAEDVTFVTTFEPHSDPVRKNASAVVRAFREAFDGSRGVSLVIKLNNSSTAGTSRAEIVDLRARCAGDSRIRLIETPMTYAEILTLYASADVFVSLHRAEGLGLALMEAMTLGKPVIATAWSGNMSFMDYSTGCLIGYRLVPAVSSFAVYRGAMLGDSAVWAEPDVSEAARWMRRLADDANLRKAIGERAGAAMSRYNEEARRGVFLDELRVIHEHHRDTPAGRRRKSAEFGFEWEARLRRLVRPSLCARVDWHVRGRWRAR